MCDIGRLEYKKANELRLLTPIVRENGTPKAALSWESLLVSTANRLRREAEAHGPEGVAVIASPQFSNEELFLVRKLAEELLTTKNLAFTAKTPGDSVADDFLLREDKNPNSRGAQLLGISGERFDDIVRRISEGTSRALLVCGDILGDLPESETEALLSKVPFVVQIGTCEGPVFRAAHAVLPRASFAEQGGTWTNHSGRVQRFHMAFPPRGKARTGIEILTGLAARLGGEWRFAGEGSVFRAIADSCAPFAGMSYESLGSSGRVAGEKK